MADIAALSLEVKFDKVEQSTVALREQTKAASAAERAAQKWGTAQDAAGRSADDYSKRVQRTIKDLEFQRQQLTRSATEQERHNLLRRAGVTAASAEGQAISASVAALQAQKAALGQTSLAAQAYGHAWAEIKRLATVAFLIELGRRLLEMGKNAIEAVGSLDEMADQAGISTRALQALQFAAVQNGVELEQLNTGVAKFSQKIGEAATGAKPMIDALDDLGVKILDANGKLRPTETLMQEVAKAILAIDDPAKRAAASVDFFGKAGSKFKPVLVEMAKGLDVVALSADAMGAMVSDSVVKRLDLFSDAMARGALRSRNLFASFAGATLQAMDKVGESFDRQSGKLNAWIADMLGVSSIGEAFDDLGKKIGKFVDESVVEGVRWAAMFVEAFRSMPEELGKVFSNAWNEALNMTKLGLNSLTKWLNENTPDALSWLRPNATQFGTTPSGSAPDMSGVAAKMAAAGDAAAESARNLQKQRDLQNAATAAAAGRAAARGDGLKFSQTPPPGAKNPLPKDAGKEAENQAKAYQKLSDQLEQTAKAQDLMTAASARGDVQFEAVKIHLEAQQKTLEIYGKVLDDTDPKLRKIEELLTRISQGKAAEAFNVATTELQKQNVILEAQIRLMNEAPEIQAREIALIKAKQEAEKGGAAITAEAIDARRQAIEQNETLKTQAEDLKKAQELWTAPLQQALQDIQKTAADAFEEMLSSGKVNFEELGNVFKKMIVRMAAEFLALATVRPVMSVLVNAISPGSARQFGLDSGAGGAGGGGLFGGGGSAGGLFGGGGLSDFFGKTLIGGGENLGPLQPGAPSLGTSGGLTVGGALGGAAGIGLGAFQILSGKGSTSSMIGGGASALGGLVSMIGPLTALGSAAGPIGMGIGLLGSILPMLFGGGTPEPPTLRAQGSLRMSGSGSSVSGSADEGMGSLTGALNDVAASIKKITDAAGGLRGVTKEFGIDVESFSKGDFSNQTVFVTDPSGGRRQWGQSSDPAQQAQALDTASAHMAHAMLMVSESISDNMRQGLSQFGQQNLQHAFSMEELSKVVAELNGFDEALKTFGTSTTDASQAIQAINDTFNELYNTAARYNLAQSEIAKIDAERNRLQLKATEDFSDSISQGLLGFTDPLQGQLAALDKQKQKDLANNADYVRMVAGYTDQAANIEQLYYLRRNEVIDQANAAALAAAKQAAEEQLRLQQDMLNAVASSVSRVQDLIRQLTPGGDLANVDPRSQLAGLRATYAASYAQAISDPANSALIEKAVTDARTLAETSLKFNAGDANYERDRRMLLDQQAALQQATAGQGLGRATDPDVKNLLQQLLTATEKSVSTNDNAAQRDADMATVLGLLARFLANGRTAA